MSMSTPIITGAGVELSMNAQRIAEVIKDFDDTLELQWIPPAERSAFGIDYEPYRIVQFHPNYEPYTVMWIREDQLDHRVIQALFKARNQTIDDIEAEDNAKRAMKMRAQMDQEAADAEFTTWAIRQNRTVKHNGRKYE